MEDSYQKRKKNSCGLSSTFFYTIFLLLFINLFPNQSVAQERTAVNDCNDSYIKVPLISINDSSIVQVLDWVLKNDSNNVHFSSDVSYSFRIYYDKEVESNVMKIEGSDLNRLFLESVDILGYFHYKNHTFFLLENFDKFFTLTKHYEKMKIDKKQKIDNDDRFEIYFFGYSNGQFYRFIL